MTSHAAFRDYGRSPERLSAFGVGCYGGSVAARLWHAATAARPYAP